MTSIITYEQMKSIYNDFKKNLPVEEFSRYYKEYSYMKNLIELAEKENLTNDIKEYEIIQQTAIEKLQKLGYEFI